MHSRYSVPEAGIAFCCFLFHSGPIRSYSGPILCFQIRVIIFQRLTVIELVYFPLTNLLMVEMMKHLDVDMVLVC